MSDERLIISPIDTHLGTRRCRGHWHITGVNDDGTEGEDLWFKGEPDSFPTAEDALQAIVRSFAPEPIARPELFARGLTPTEPTPT